MEHVNGNEGDTVRSPRFETPTFDPRGAFAWTLRGGEIARQEARREAARRRAPRYETATFDPRGAFAWTLRSGEVARLEQRRAAARRLPGHATA
jgi:hypothetical protein